jgi:hypothetical protein
MGNGRATIGVLAARGVEVVCSDLNDAAAEETGGLVRAATGVPPSTRPKLHSWASLARSPGKLPTPRIACFQMKTAISLLIPWCWTEAPPTSPERYAVRSSRFVLMNRKHSRPN